MDKILIYATIHLFGNFLVVMSVGGSLVWSINGGKTAHAWKKQLGAFHGIGLLLSLLGGFGLLAVLKIPFPWPFWVWGKLVIWIVFGGLLPLIVRKQEKAKFFWYLTILLVLVALILVEFKI